MSEREVDDAAPDGAPDEIDGAPAAAGPVTTPDAAEPVDPAEVEAPESAAVDPESERAASGGPGRDMAAVFGLLRLRHHMCRERRGLTARRAELDRAYEALARKAADAGTTTEESEAWRAMTAAQAAVAAAESAEAERAGAVKSVEARYEREEQTFSERLSRLNKAHVPLTKAQRAAQREVHECRVRADAAKGGVAKIRDGIAKTERGKVGGDELGKMKRDLADLAKAAERPGVALTEAERKLADARAAVDANAEELSAARSEWRKTRRVVRKEHDEATARHEAAQHELATARERVTVARRAAGQALFESGAAAEAGRAGIERMRTDARDGEAALVALQVEAVSLHGPASRGVFYVLATVLLSVAVVVGGILAWNRWAPVPSETSVDVPVATAAPTPVPAEYDRGLSDEEIDELDDTGLLVD